ncbi:ABC transporter ATP-binding protein [Paucibacter sp. TC2R-5]|uniref:ABC transporter ATP-binding protein n=1 Tax=Paucibacter sp. TC2R-5 TaxID=2893555 RepID=UPI0021E434ED|nr:ABC transporter ATP-binding protein [Paucibacter sp. TC2R-5]MCV2357390.1 ABC transporter ATP-binding protein [Paucibacter sp. TC2R-5]
MNSRPDSAHITPISAAGLHLSLGANTVLRGLDLAVPAGAVVALLGRNGAGKSTLIRCLVGLSVPDVGACSLAGCPSMALSEAVRQGLGYVSQTPDLLDWLNGYEHLEQLGGLYAGWDNSHALCLAALLQLPLGVKAKNLSLGDQQKLSLVLALGHRPELLILDEPAASLDPIARRAFMNALFDDPAGAAPRTVLISSHLLADVERLASHLAFMRDGRIQLFGERDALSEHLRLLECAPAQVSAELSAQALHQRWTDGRLHLLLDGRVSAQAEQGRPLSLDELFLELNQ